MPCHSQNTSSQVRRCSNRDPTTCLAGISRDSLDAFHCLRSPTWVVPMFPPGSSDPQPNAALLVTQIPARIPQMLSHPITRPKSVVET